MKFQTVADSIYEEIAACSRDMQQIDQDMCDMKVVMKDLVKDRAKLRRMLHAIQKENTDNDQD